MSGESSLAVQTEQHSDGLFKPSLNGVNMGAEAQKSATSNDAHVQEVIRAAQRELRELLRERADIMKRIGTVKQTIVGLANMFGDEVLDEELLDLVDRRSNGRQPGFTRACRMVLIEAKTPLSAREVCEQLRTRFGGLLINHKDPLASATTVLNRLADYGEARSSLNSQGKRAWEWVAEKSTGGGHHRPAV
jgi:hypothetical protein